MHLPIFITPNRSCIIFSLKNNMPRIIIIQNSLETRRLPVICCNNISSLNSISIWLQSYVSQSTREYNFDGLLTPSFKFMRTGISKWNLVQLTHDLAQSTIANFGRLGN